MADGKTHAKWNTVGILAGVAVAAYLAHKGQNEAALGVVTGAVGGFMITPDIDHHAKTHEERRIIWLFGMIVGRIWMLYWLPYEKLLGHRNPLSHLPGIATYPRIWYLMPLAWAISYYINLPLSNYDLVGPALLPNITTAFGLFAFLAWSAQDLIHLALDDFKTF